MTSRATLIHLLVGLGVLLLAALSAWQSAAIPAAGLFNIVGPTVAGWFVTGFLTLTGLGLVVAALRGGWIDLEAEEAVQWGSLGFVLLGLLVNIALIEWAGFILASTAMFPLVARGFGSRSPLRDALIGFVLSCVSYVGFDRVLGYKIGTGMIENLI